MQVPASDRDTTDFRIFQPLPDAHRTSDPWKSGPSLDRTICMQIRCNRLEFAATAQVLAQTDLLSVDWPLCGMRPHPSPCPEGPALVNWRMPRSHKARLVTSPVLLPAGLRVPRFEGFAAHLEVGLVLARSPQSTDRAHGHRPRLPRDGHCPAGGGALPAGVRAVAAPRVPRLVPIGSTARISCVAWACSRALPTSDPSCMTGMPQRNPWTQDEIPSRQAGEGFASSRSLATLCRRTTLLQSSSPRRNQHRRPILDLLCGCEVAGYTTFDVKPFAAGGGDFARTKQRASGSVLTKLGSEEPKPPTRVGSVHRTRYV